jgi:hypothetical protein
LVVGRLGDVLLLFRVALVLCLDVMRHVERPVENEGPALLQEIDFVKPFQPKFTDN